MTTRRKARSLAYLFRSFLKSEKRQDELDEEFQFHLDMRVRDLMRSGLSQAEARREAVREFGGVQQLKEQCRDNWGIRLYENFKRDLRYSWRQILKQKRFSVVIILIMGISIGLNTLMFSLIDSVYLNPGLYPDEDRIVRIADVFSGRNARNIKSWMTSPLYYLERKEQSRVLENIGVYQTDWAIVRDLDNRSNSPYQQLLVSPSLLETLSLKPFLGRFFTQEDIDSGNHEVVILGYAFWHNRYGGDPNVIGSKMLIDDEPYTIIGVMRSDFNIPFGFDPDGTDPRFETPFMTPWIERPWHKTARGRQHNYCNTLGLLKPGQTVQNLKTELQEINSRNSPLFPEAYRYEIEHAHEIAIVPLKDDLVRNVRTQLSLLLISFAFILAMACANVSSLFLSQNRVRSGEFGTRAALGASRLRLIGQILIEKCTYSFLSCAVGLFFLWIAHAIISQTNLYDLFLIPPKPRWSYNLLIYLLISGVAIGVFTGLLSTLGIISKEGFGKMMKEQSRSSTRGKAAKRYQSTLLWCQLTLSTVILVFGGFLLKSFVQILKIDPGFDPDNLYTVSFNLADSDYDNDAKRQFMAELKKRTQELSDVESAGISFFPPLKWGGNHTTRMVTEQDWIQGIRDSSICIQDSVDTTFLATLDISLISGRYFNESDLRNNARNIIIDRRIADKHFNDTDPIGKRIALRNHPSAPDRDTPGNWYTVVGVVESVVRSNLIDPSAMGTIYRNVNEYIPYWFTLVAKSKSNPTHLRASIRDIRNSIDPFVVMDKEETMSEIMNKQHRFNRYLLSIVSLIALIGLFITGIGLYGIIRFLITQNRKEISIRIALGEGIHKVRLNVVSYWAKISMISTIIRASLTVLLSIKFETLLYKVNPGDPFVLLFSVFFIILIIIGTAWLSSTSIKRSNLLEVLRVE